MMKKLLFFLLLSIVPVHGGYEDYEQQEQQAFYDVGICLAQQNKIDDWSSLKQAAAGMYDNIEDIQELVDLFLIMNGVSINQITEPMNQLFDIIEQEIARDYSEYNHIQMSFVELIAIYQDLFSFFLQTSKGLHSPALFLSYVNNSCDLMSDEERETFQSKMDYFELIFEKFEILLDEIL